MLFAVAYSKGGADKGLDYQLIHLLPAAPEKVAGRVITSSIALRRTNAKQIFRLRPAIRIRRSAN
jgi:hypothetical protein